MRITHYFGDWRVRKVVKPAGRPHRPFVVAYCSKATRVEGTTSPYGRNSTASAPRRRVDNGSQPPVETSKEVVTPRRQPAADSTIFRRASGDRMMNIPGGKAGVLISA